MKQIFSLDIFLVLVLSINGLHFLGGTITWRPLNESATGTPVAIVITQTYSWTYSRISCDDVMIATNQFVPSYGGSLLTLKLTCITNCGAGSVGYSNIDVIPRCTDFSAPVGTTVGQRSDIVYLNADDDFSVAFQSSAWRPLATSLSAGWSISSHINLKLRSDNGLYNNAPVATMMSPIYIPVNQPRVIYIPIADADGDTLRCRWSTNSNGVDECGGVCPPASLPPSTIIYPNCTIIITGQVIGDWFAVTLMVEDFINSTSTTPLSSVPVQFLVQVVNATCPTPPEIIGLLPEQSCTSVIVGQPFTSQVIAINNCGPSVTIDDIATLSFSGMIKSTISQLNSTLYYKNLTWTPTITQLGYQMMCAMAIDSQDAQSSQYCFKLYVSENGVCSCPGDPCISTTSTTSTSTTSTTSTSSTTTTTSTTSTSSTSTSTTSITATTTIRKPNPINWLLIGGIIGLVLLAALTLCCCLCWRYFCPLDADEYTGKRQGTIELYHIERCIDPDCRRPDVSSVPGFFLTFRKKYITGSTLNGSANSVGTTRTVISNSFINTQDRLIKDMDESEKIPIRNNSLLSTVVDRVQRKPISSIPVIKVKNSDRVCTVGNPSINHPDRTSNEEKNDSLVVNLKNSENVKISRIKSTVKPRPYSMDTHVQKNNTVGFINGTRSRCVSTDGVRIVRVTSVQSKPSIQHLHQSINSQTTRLDVIDETRESSRPSEDIMKNKVTVTHVSYADRQKESNNINLHN